MTKRTGESGREGDGLDGDAADEEEGQVSAAIRRNASVLVVSWQLEKWIGERYERLFPILLYGRSFLRPARDRRRSVTQWWVLHVSMLTSPLTIEFKKKIRFKVYTSPSVDLCIQNYQIPCKLLVILVIFSNLQRSSVPTKQSKAKQSKACPFLTPRLRFRSPRSVFSEKLASINSDAIRAFQRETVCFGDNPSSRPSDVL